MVFLFFKYRLPVLNSISTAVMLNDELIFDTLKGEQQQVEKIVEEVMNHVCELSVPLKVDIESGTDWYQAK